MDGLSTTSVGELPEEMLKFILQHGAVSEGGARLGQLARRGRAAIPTPHYIVPTSRGVIPHLSPDVLQRHTKISAVYVPLEDFIEKSHTDPPIFSAPVDQQDESTLRKYTGLPDQCLSVLGPRRVPGIPCPAPNTNNAISVSTSVGFRSLELKQYNNAVARLRADVSTSLADVIMASDKPSAKRVEKSADRTHAWLRDTVDARNGKTAPADLPLFASLPPLEPEQLSLLLADLVDDFAHDVAGLCVHDAAIIPALSEPLRLLPTICLTNPATPHALLAAVHAGIDLITVPFVTDASEHGIALSFSFPAPPGTTDQPLGIDLWSTTHATDLRPLSDGCTCYACTRHHRAYVHHLLSANEMLAWTLLQIHNFAVMETFFAGVRSAVGDSSFERQVDAFGAAYEATMPAATGAGPRVRGYQMKSVGGGEAKKNPRAWGKVDEMVQGMMAGGDQADRLAEAESGIATPDTGMEGIEAHGLASRVEK